MDDPKDSTSAFEEALKKAEKDMYVLRLYIAGMNPKSLAAVENIRRLCDEQLPGKCQLDVIDIYQQPILAMNGQIVAAPTLVKELPPPLKKLVGSMADTDRVLIGLDLQSRVKSRKDQERAGSDHARG
jgi:circadian clock protein KaiB